MARRGCVTLNQYGMRRTTAAFASLTNPVASASVVAGPAAAVTASVPGTFTVAGADTVAPSGPVCGAIETVQVPVPPPASVSAIDRVALVPTRNSPSERLVGEAKISGALATGMSIMPPPSRVVGASVVPATCTGVPVRTSADFTCAGVQSGWRWRRSAAAPATCGAAMLVPLNDVQVPSRGGTEDVMSTPGALTSGFSSSEIGVGPPLEKSATTSLLLTAAAAIAFVALAGEMMLPFPSSSKSLPAASVATTPASAAPSIAATTRSRDGSISGSPSERLITSIPSLIAASMPAAISGAFPFRPKFFVGTLSTL